jgi:hypothetical protein
MSFVLRPPDEIVPLTRRLHGLGQVRRLVLAGTGVLAVLAVAGFALAGLGVLDAWLHLAAGLRAIGLLGLVAAVGAIAHYSVRRPLRQSAEPARIADLLESRHPEFNDVLASATDFDGRGSDGDLVADRFRRAAIRRAERLADRHEIAGIVPTGRLWRWTVLAMLAFASLGSLVVVNPSRAAVAAIRLFDPFGSHPWPPKTTLVLLEPERSPARLAKGQPFPIRFSVRGVLPPEATLSVRLVGGAPHQESIALATDGAPEITVDHVLLPDRTTRDFDFRIVANDADSGWHPVTVASPPRLVPLDGRPSPQIRLTYRPYTDQKPTDWPDGSGGIETVAGTRFDLRAATDRPIVRAWLHYEGDRTGANLAAAVAGLAAQDPIFAVLAPSASASFPHDIPVMVGGPDRTRLSVAFEPPLKGLYSLRFEDETGLAGIQKLDLQTFPDPEPVVTLLRPSPASDPLVLVPTATVPVRVRADDRTYALKSLWLEYRVNESPFVRIPLVDADVSARALPAVTGAIGTGASLRPHEFEILRSLPLATLRRPDGSPPGDGDIVVLRGAADDRDDYTIAKQPGRSAEVVVRVLSAESLTAHLQKELAALRPDIERATTAQRDAAAKTDRAAKAATPDGRPTTESRGQLARADQEQRILRGQLTDARDGPRAKAEKLRDTARANALGETPVARRADAVARILGDLEEKHLAEIEAKLEAAKAAAESEAPMDRPAFRESVEKAGKQQSAALEKLAAAAEELEQWAATAEVRGDARQLKDRVAKAAEAAKATADRLPTGASPDRLPASDRGALDKTAEELGKAADQAGKLISKADRVAEQRRADAAKATAAANAKASEADRAAADAARAPAGSPVRAAAQAKADAANAEAAALRDTAKRAADEAAALEKASKNAGRQAIADELRAAAAAQKENRSGEAQAGAAKAFEKLEKMTADLAERRDDVDELAKKRKDAADAVDRFADRQDELAKKAAKAAANPNASERTEELRKLAGEQETLRRETEQLSRKLDRDGAGDAAEQLRRAAAEMEQARDDLAEGRDPKANPDEALEQLERAKEQLDKPMAEPKEQLEREQREQFAKSFKTFLEKQAAAVAESERLTVAAAKARKWERPLQASLAALGERETALAKEIRQFAEDKVKELKVFDAMLRRAAAEMDRAAERILERKADVVLADPSDFDPESEAAADETARRPMRAALRRLEQIVRALEDDPKKPGAPKPMNAGAGGMPGEGGMPGDGTAPGAPPIAQLKALRDWQKEINDRTAEFAKLHPDRDKLTDDDKDELQEIEDAQKEIAKLLDELLPMLQPMGGDLP